MIKSLFSGTWTLGTRFWRTFQNIGNRIDMPISSKKQSINIRAKRLLMLF